MKSKRRTSEHSEQVKTVSWFRLQYPRLASCLFAIPNGGKRDKITATMLKSEGVLAGVPDLFLMVAKGSYHGLFVEMKSLTGRLSQSQKDFKIEAEKQGYLVIVAHGFDEAREQIHGYLFNSK